MPSYVKGQLLLPALTNIMENIVEKDTVTFVVAGKKFILSKDKLKMSEFLNASVNTNIGPKGEDIKIEGLDLESFTEIFNYIDKGTRPGFLDLECLNFLGMSEHSTYELSLFREEDMRGNMYEEASKEEPMNSDPYYGLVKITEEEWSFIRRSIFEHDGKDDLLFPHVSLKPRSWENVQKSLSEIQFLASSTLPDSSTLSMPESKKDTSDSAPPRGTLVAGGRVFSALFECKASDTDVFIYDGQKEDENTRQKAGVNVIREIKDSIMKNFKGDRPEDYKFSLKKSSVKRTRNAITFQCVCKRTSDYQDVLKKYGTASYERKEEIQVILRLYRTPSEILHGFDIDSCCMGYDGKDIWITNRCLFSLLNGYNTVNFDRLSPSYEYRLAKYAVKGMSVKVPNFSRENVDKEALEEHFQIYVKNKSGSSVDYRYGHLKELKGLSLVLYLEYHHANSRKNWNIESTFNALAMKHSDYTLIPFRAYTGGLASVETSMHMIYYISHKCLLPLQVYSEDVRCERFDIDQEKADKDVDWKAVVEKGEFKDEELMKYVDALSKGEKKIEDYKIAEEGPYGEAVFSYDLCANNFIESKKIFFLHTKLDSLETILEVGKHFYMGLSAGCVWDIPRITQFKTTKPGEQMTNTFHKLTLEDNSLWYDNKFYLAGAQ